MSISQPRFGSANGSVFYTTSIDMKKPKLNKFSTPSMEDTTSYYNIHIQSFPIRAL